MSFKDVEKVVSRFSVNPFKWLIKLRLDLPSIEDGFNNKLCWLHENNILKNGQPKFNVGRPISYVFKH